MADMNEIRKKLPELCGFLNAWFIDSDEDDKAIVDEFTGSESVKNIVAVIREMKLCLAMIPFPGFEIGEEANRCFDSEEDAKEWLEMLNISLITHMKRE